MDRLIAVNSVASGSADAAPSTGTPQFATNGNPATGVPATVFPAYAFNAIQEELIAIIVTAGITTDKTNNTQVVNAIRALIKQSSILTETGAANAYTTVNPTPLVVGTLVHGVRQTVQFVHANTGASTYAPDGLAVKPIYGLALAALQGGEIPAKGVGNMIYIVDAAINGGNGAWILIECTGGTQQVLAGTASNHAVNQGQVIGIGQLFTSVFGSRALGSTYTNSTGKPIVIYVFGTTTASTSAFLSIIINGVNTVLTQQPSNASGVGVSAVIPTGATYQVGSSSVTLNNWYELR